ncbi:MAG TPA: HIT family protein [Gaiellaceae bacterium]|nr:HIT family protein [Gaiellaceae bacterium]
MSGCLICDRVALASDGRNPYVVAEMEHSYFVVGDSQFHRGYALVLLKEHVREPFDLPVSVQCDHFREVMRAAEALHATFQPVKMNCSCYGNAEPHVHWHIVPRYADDPHPRQDPWREAERFSERLVSVDEARSLAAEIRANFA